MVDGSAVRKLRLSIDHRGRHGKKWLVIVTSLFVLSGLLTSFPSLPAFAATDDTPIDVQNGMNFSCALTYGNDIYCWGDNTYGQLGNGTRVSRTTPGPSATGFEWSRLAVGYTHVCAITTAGAAYCWGQNLDGQVSSDLQDGLTPLLQTWATGWTSITAGYYSTCGVRSGAAYCRGDNDFGQVGVASTDRTVETLTQIAGSWTSLSLGTNTTCGIKSDASGWCWGDNASSQLTVASPTATHVPTLISGSYSWSSIDVGSGHVCGITTGTATYCWGSNAIGENGVPGVTKRSTPTAVVGDEPFVSIAASTQGTCATTASNNLYCWGKNGGGQFGTGVSNNVFTTPTLSGSGHLWKTYAFSFGVMSNSGNGCGVTFDDRIFCAGTNDYAQLGNGTTNESLYPTGASYGPMELALSDTSYSAQEGAFVTVTVQRRGVSTGTVSVSYQTTDGTALSPGDYTATSGILTFADGQSAATIQVPVALDAITEGSETFTISLSNPTGPISLVAPTSATISILDDTGEAARISAGNAHTCYVSSDKNGYCWGAGSNSRLGDGFAANRPSPTQISGNHSWRLISAGNLATCGVDINGIGYCWGKNGTTTSGSIAGMLGVGSTDVNLIATTPTAIPDRIWQGIAVAAQHACGIVADSDISSDGSAYCWGSDAGGRLGDGSGDSHPTGQVTPLLVPLPANVTGWYSIAVGSAHTCAIAKGTEAAMTEGALYCWGQGASGKLGQGSGIVSQTSPAKVVNPIEGRQLYKSLSLGTSHSCAITVAGNAYCWGDDSLGQLGSNLTDTTSATPLLVSNGAAPANIAWASIETGDDHTCAIATASSLGYCWGVNTEGRLGNGSSAASEPLPVAIVMPSGVTFAQISGGAAHTCAVASGAGSAYCWGESLNHRLGTGSNAADEDDPVVIFERTISVSDKSVTETDAGSTMTTISVNLSRTSRLDVLVDFNAIALPLGSGAATGGADFATASGTVTIAAGTTTATIPTTLYGDTDLELDEAFQVGVTNPRGASLKDDSAAVTIVDNDLRTLNVTDVTISEGDSGATNAVFTASIQVAASSNITFDATVADGTATADLDYTSATGSYEISSGATEITITVPILGDTSDEGDETYTVVLSNVVGLAVVGDGSGLGTITDDDEASATPAISLVVSVTGTSTGTSCNAITSNTTVGDNALSLTQLNPGASIIHVHSVNVNTNSTKGYVATLRLASGLTDGLVGSIPGFAASNATPDANFGDAAGGIGYSTGDSALDPVGSGANRFVGSKWAGLTSSPGTVAWSDGPVNESTCVAVKTVAGAMDPAGTYTGTMIFSVAPRF